MNTNRRFGATRAQVLMFLTEDVPFLPQADEILRSKGWRHVPVMALFILSKGQLIVSLVTNIKD